MRISPTDIIPSPPKSTAWLQDRVLYIGDDIVLQTVGPCFVPIVLPISFSVDDSGWLPQLCVLSHPSFLRVCAYYDNFDGTTTILLEEPPPSITALTVTADTLWWSVMQVLWMVRETEKDSALCSLLSEAWRIVLSADIASSVVSDPKEKRLIFVWGQGDPSLTQRLCGPTLFSHWIQSIPAEILNSDLTFLGTIGASYPSWSDLLQFTPVALRWPSTSQQMETISLRQHIKWAEQQRTIAEQRVLREEENLAQRCLHLKAKAQHLTQQQDAAIEERLQHYHNLPIHKIEDANTNTA